MRAEGDVDNVLLRHGRVRAVHGLVEWTLRFGMDRRTATRLAKEATDDLPRPGDYSTAWARRLRAANSTATTSAENARDDIRASGEWYSWLLEERRRVLLRRVGAWREKSGRRRESASSQTSREISENRDAGSARAR